MSRVAILIDGSNLVGGLYRAKLGYPALKPLVDHLRGNDDLSFVRFYGAPPPRQPWKGRWRAFVSANRHVHGLDFFEAYRHASTGEEKAVDVALAADLLYGTVADHFDRAVIVGGDGDYVYALKLARTITDLHVYVLGSPPKGLSLAHIPFSILRRSDLIARKICANGSGSPVPAAHRASPSDQWDAVILRGSDAVLAVDHSSY